MIDRLLKRFAAPTSDPLLSEDARLAIAALMVRVARIDDHYDMAEAAKITQVLMERYALDHQSAEELRSEAENVETKAPDTVRFTRLIKDAVPYEERSAVAVALWRVVLADEKRQAEEDAFLRLVVSLIGVNDVDSALARQKAQASF